MGTSIVLPGASGGAPAPLSVTFLSLAERTANATSAAMDIGSRGTVRLALTVTALAGTTPGVIADLETSQDGVTDWKFMNIEYDDNVDISVIGTAYGAAAAALRYVRANLYLVDPDNVITCSVTAEVF